MFDKKEFMKKSAYQSKFQELLSSEIKNEKQEKKFYKSKTLNNIQIFYLKTFDFNMLFKDDELEREDEIRQKLMDKLEEWISACNTVMAQRIPNMVNIIDYYISSDGYFSIVLEQQTYSIDTLIKETKSEKVILNDFRLRNILLQYILTLAQCSSNNIQVSYKNRSETFFESDIVKFENFDVNWFLMSPQELAEANAEKDAALTNKFNFKEVGALMQELLLGQTLKLDQSNLAKGQDVKVPGVIQQMAEIIKKLLNDDKFDVYEVMKQELMRTTMNEQLSNVQFYFKTMKTYIKDEYFYGTCKAQLDRCMSIFDVLCNKASLTQIEDNYEIKLKEVQSRQEKVIKDKQEVIANKKRRIENIRALIEKKEESIAKIKINLLSENEQQFKHVGHSQVTFGYQEFSRRRKNLQPGHADYVYLDIPMDEGVHIFRIKILQYDNYICVGDVSNLSTSVERLDYYFHYISPTECNNGNVGHEFYKSNPFFSVGDIIEVSVDSEKKSFVFKDQNTKYEMLNGVFTGYSKNQRLIFALKDHPNTKIKVIDQYIKNW